MKLSILKLFNAVLMLLLIGIPAEFVYAKEYTVKVGSPLLSKCGSNIDNKSSTFRTKDYWHGLTQCLRNLRDVWSRHGPNSVVAINNNAISIRDLVRRQVVYSLNQPYVLFYNKTGSSIDDGKPFSEVVDSNLKILPSIERVVLTNDRGVPYNGMGQSGIAYFLYQFSLLSAKINDNQAKLDLSFYSSIANFSINTILTNTDEGGLSTNSNCGDDNSELCSWFHSVTSRDRETKAGGTLNQDLHVIRDFGLIADLLQKNDPKTHAVMISRLNDAVTAGINQLFISKGHEDTKYKPPNFADFLSPSVGSGRVSWLFYGFNVASVDNKSGAYFLGTKGRDCRYHIHVLNLLANILARADRNLTLPTNLKSCSAPVASAYRTIAIMNLSSDRKEKWADGADSNFECNYLKKNKAWNQKFLDKIYGSCETNNLAP